MSSETTNVMKTNAIKPIDRRRRTFLCAFLCLPVPDFQIQSRGNKKLSIRADIENVQKIK